VCGQKLRAFGRQARIARAQARGDCIERVVLAQPAARLDLIKPARVAGRRLIGPARSQTKPFEVHHCAHTLRPDAGIHQCDVAAHAVADQRDLLLWCAMRQQCIEQQIEISQVIWKPIAVAARIGKLISRIIVKQRRKLLMKNPNRNRNNVTKEWEIPGA